MTQPFAINQKKILSYGLIYKIIQQGNSQQQLKKGRQAGRQPGNQATCR